MIGNHTKITMVRAVWCGVTTVPSMFYDEMETTVEKWDIAASQKPTERHVQKNVEF